MHAPGRYAILPSTYPSGYRLADLGPLAMLDELDELDGVSAGAHGYGAP